MGKALKFANAHKIDISVFFLLALLAPFFFFKLGQTSLVSWDEAWYAAIARNILKTKDIFVMHYNGNVFNDHPPAGFWLIAISFKLLGISEFAARVPSAILGMLTLFVTYLLGKELFNRVVGFSSALALSSASWFLYRARSGNLDVFLTFFFVLTIYLAIKATKNPRYLIWMSISLLLLFLTKSVVPFTALPVLLLIFWKKIPSRKYLVAPLLVFVLGISLWLYSQFRVYPNILKRYFGIGLPSVSLETDYLENFNIIKGYLHEGIGKWFWPGVFSLFAGLVTRKKSFYILSLFCFAFFAPFIFSSRGQIWHLIPLYPFMILAFFGFAHFFAEIISRNKWIPAVFILIISFYYSFMLLKLNWYQFINIPAFVSDEAILSKEAGLYTGDYIIDGDFVPAAVFYSNKIVQQTYVGGLTDLFESDDSFVLFTKQERLDSEGINSKEYEILKSDRDKILVRKI